VTGSRGPTSPQRREALDQSAKRLVGTVVPPGVLAAFPWGCGEVVLTTDGGATFSEVDLPNAPAVDSERAPGGLFFTDADHGWVFFSNDQIDGSAYVYPTVDGGLNWSASTVPAALLAAAAKVSFRAITFALDNQKGYLVGYYGNDSAPLLLKSTDGGATWNDISTSFAGFDGVSPPVKP